MNYIYETDELYHHGVLGMKWGRHKAARQAKRTNIIKSGNKVYQKKMSDEERKQYANQRIAKNGAKAAVTAERRSYNKSVLRKSLGIIGETYAIEFAAVGVSALSGFNPAVTTGAAYVASLANTGNVVGKMVTMAKRKKNEKANIDEIKRQKSMK